MQRNIAELVDELRRLKPGSPALHHFENALTRANTAPAPQDSADVRRVFGAFSSNVVALLKQP